MKLFLMISRNIILIVFLLSVNFARGQESMMGDISYPFLEKLIAAAKQNYPKFKVYEKKVGEAKINIQKAKLAWFNTLNLTYLYSPTNSVTLVNPTYSGGFQFGIFFNIGTLFTNGPNVKVAKEDLKIARLDQDEYNLNLEAIVKERYFLYVQQLSLLNWRIKDMENTESTAKDIKYKFEKGEETFENYNKARAFYSNVVQSKIQAEGTYLVAKSSLEEIIGVPLESIK
jgi:outer membrane protein TolC